MTGESTRAVYVGVAELFRLNQACFWIWQAFGHVPYLVGSAMERRDYRDVDVRLLLPDDEYERLFPGDPAHWGRMSLWSYLCAAISDQLARVSGLPVDFQIQAMTAANGEYGGRPRSALGVGLATFEND